jgi:hypothetical protein
LSSTNTWLSIRAANLAPGTCSSAHRSRPPSGRSGFGMHQIGVRWKTVSFSTSGAIAGITWTAEAPVPITPTRLPFSPTPWSQREVCIVIPSNASSPSISGYFGCDSAPAALIT